jgi:hypothetical protein
VRVQEGKFSIVQKNVMLEVTFRKKQLTFQSGNCTILWGDNKEGMEGTKMDTQRVFLQRVKLDWGCFS